VAARTSKAESGATTRAASAGRTSNATGDDALKRERAGTYRTKDGRFTVEQSSSGWLLLDGEQTDDLGLPLARGPFPTLDAAREAIAAARSGPAPTSTIEPRAARRKPVLVGPPAGSDDKGRAKSPRRAPKRADAAALVIREIRAVDGDALRALWKEAGFRSLGDDDRSLARLARRNPGLALVATESGRIVGSALGAWDGRRGWLYHVTTAESHRRKGVATRLVRQVEAALRDLGCPKVSVLVRDENEDAAEFWTELGYAVGSRQYAKELEGA
jgi:ribosomal protein S18 acetylase RimI-like enzyme